MKYTITTLAITGCLATYLLYSQTLPSSYQPPAELLEAIENNNPQAVELVVHSQPSLINARSIGNRTPLMEACIGSCIQPNMPACLHCCSQTDSAPWKDSYDQALANRRIIIQLLITAGADLDARDDDGCTALHLTCAMNNDPQRVVLLIAAGANTTLKNHSGQTALDYAITDGNQEVIHLLWVP